MSAKDGSPLTSSLTTPSWRSTDPGSRIQRSQMSDQLSVHRNPARAKAVVSSFVVVQSNQFRHSSRRVVVPLLAAEAFASPKGNVGPRLVIDSREVVLGPLQITNMPRDALGPPVATPIHDDDRIVRTLDPAMSRAWRWRKQFDRRRQSAACRYASTSRKSASNRSRQRSKLFVRITASIAWCRSWRSSTAIDSAWFIA